jgi:hypothetical protein
MSWGTLMISTLNYSAAKEIKQKTIETKIT